MEKERKKVYVLLAITWLLIFAVLAFFAWLFKATTPAAGAETVFYRYGFYGYSYSRDQVHWSIYEHKLVSGDVYYSPYAFKYGHSGLVNKEFRYSPYALKYGQSGLISQYDARPYCPNPVVVVTQPNLSFEQIFKQETEQQKRYQENVEARRKRVEQRKKEMASMASAKK